mmetsp:Transcript_21143/g.45665  ORF Transcript_21143/g.45665 Transcript_21143/m.45665 type:complete len:262 (-) Transcript_21143:177-962(-)
MASVGLVSAVSSSSSCSCGSSPFASGADGASVAPPSSSEFFRPVLVLACWMSCRTSSLSWLDALPPPRPPPLSVLVPPPRSVTSLLAADPSPMMLPPLLPSGSSTIPVRALASCISRRSSISFSSLSLSSSTSSSAPTPPLSLPLASSGMQRSALLLSPALSSGGSSRSGIRLLRSCNPKTKASQSAMHSSSLGSYSTCFFLFLVVVLSSPSLSLLPSRHSSSSLSTSCSTSTSLSTSSSSSSASTSPKGQPTQGLYLTSA